MILNDKRDQLVGILKNNNLTIATAESCTGGLLSKLLTDVAGSSAWFKGGFVTYANSAKQHLLDVDEKLLQEHGAVSEACVRAMVISAKKKLATDVAVAISGIAGPDGESATKPVGYVCFGFAYLDKVFTVTKVIKHEVNDVRNSVRLGSCLFVIEHLLQLLHDL